MLKFMLDRNSLYNRFDFANYLQRSSDEGRPQRSVTYSTAVKRPLELALTLMLVILAAPMLIVLVVLIRMDGGPAVYGHLRTGLKGQGFRCLKLRSMRVDGDHILTSYLAANPDARLEWETHRKVRNDPRVTKLGRLLRKTSLDELPQLFNVIAGEMSLIGPRPVVEAELSRYYDAEAKDAYCSVRPGVTGLWQVSGRSDVSFDRRVALDIRYARSVSFKMDCLILWRTFRVVLLGSGAR